MNNLTAFHTFHLPLYAKYLIFAQDCAELCLAWQQAKAENRPFLLLGQGSNVLFTDDFDGVVVINQLRGICHTQDAQFDYLHVAGGENWHELVRWSLTQHIRGLENLALIPGCAGSAPVQNIGAYGVEFGDFCAYVDVLNLQTGEIFRLNKEQCQFGYRDSVFKHQYAQGFAIVAIGLKLAKNWQPVLQYGTLTTFDPQRVSAQQIFDEVCAIRQSKLPNPDEFGNAGSFFKNPLISAEEFAALKKRREKFAPLNGEILHFPQADGRVKLAAGWLIDQCGLKGAQIGGAAVHDKQALVLINKTHASAQDVLALARHVRQTVAEQFGVYLEPEVRFMGKNGEINAVEAIS